VVGDVRGFATCAVVRPRLRDIEAKVDGSLSVAVGHHQAHSDLAVGALPRAPRVLPLHARRVTALFEKTGVVDDPRRDRLVAFQLVHRVPGCQTPHWHILPSSRRREVHQPMVHRGHEPGIATGTRGHRLHALAFPVGQQTGRIYGKRRSLALVSKEATYLIQIVIEALLGARGECWAVHGPLGSHLDPPSNFLAKLAAVVLSVAWESSAGLLGLMLISETSNCTYAVRTHRQGGAHRSRAGAAPWTCAPMPLACWRRCTARIRAYHRPWCSRHQAGNRWTKKPPGRRALALPT